MEILPTQSNKGSPSSYYITLPVFAWLSSKTNRSRKVVENSEASTHLDHVSAGFETRRRRLQKRAKSCPPH